MYVCKIEGIVTRGKPGVDINQYRILKGGRDGEVELTSKELNLNILDDY